MKILNIVASLMLLITVLRCNNEIKPDKAKQTELKRIARTFFECDSINFDSTFSYIRENYKRVVDDPEETIRQPKARYYINDEANSSFRIFEDPKGVINAMSFCIGTTKIFTAEYFDNGRIMCKFSYNDKDQKDGHYTCYFEDGSARVNGFYDNGHVITDSTHRFD